MNQYEIVDRIARDLLRWPPMATACALSVMLIDGCSAAPNATETPPLPRVVVAYPRPQSVPPDDAVGRYLGQAPWICTPSGFGHKSRCFRRP